MGVTFGSCDAEGCEMTATHERKFSISGGWSGGGEVDAVSRFCCEHIDMLDSDGQPLFDVFVSGRVRR